MKSSIFTLILLLTSLIITISPKQLHSKDNPSLELGIDAGVSVIIANSDFEYAQLDIPYQRFRFGFLTQYGIEIEPAISLSHIFREKVDITDSKFTISMIQNLGSDFDTATPFVHFGPTLSWRRTDESDLQIALGGGLGVRMPIGNLINTRLQFTASRFFESDWFSSYWDFTTHFGISFLIR